MEAPSISTVTNISAPADATVEVKFNHGQVNIGISAGKSGTVIALAATRYTVQVVAHADDLDHYRDRLLELRSHLRDLTLSSKASLDEVATAATDLLLVQSALEQMQDSASVQSCSGAFVSGVTSQVTVNWTSTADGVGLWVLDCG